MFTFPPFTPETAPMRNSCDVLRAYENDGVSHARLIVFRGNSTDDSDFEVGVGKRLIVRLE